MAVRVFSRNPGLLLRKINAAVKNGSFETWSVDSDGDFTHSPEQWRNRAWFRPKVLDGKVIFNILAPNDARMSRSVYAVYHGRFIEMLLKHFDLDFDRATATSLPVIGDHLGSTHSREFDDG